MSHDKVQVGEHGQHPCTTDVVAWKCQFEQAPDNVIVIDTPSFYTDIQDFDAEGKIKSWITSR